MKIRIIKETTNDLASIIQNAASFKVSIKRFRDNKIIVYPGMVRPSYVQALANDLEDVIPSEWLSEPIRIGTGGVTEGSIILTLSDEGMKHASLIKEEEFTPIEDPKEKQPASKQYQILASMITNTKVNDQTNILSAMRALPGVTIVNSKAAEPGVDSEGQLRYRTNVDLKIDTSAIEGDIKAGIKKIIGDIKNIEGVVEFKVLPKAKETTPY